MWRNRDRDFTEILGGAIVVLVILFILGTFCVGIYQAANAPSKGVVISKNYTEGYTHTTYRTVHKGEESIRVPMQEYVEPRYYITIRGVNKKGEESEYTFSVPPSEYETISLGDTYVRKLE